MAGVTACPSAHALRELAAGALSGEEAASLERHLLECAPCMELLNGILGEDRLIDDLRRNGDGALPAQDDCTRNLIARLKALRASGPDTNASIAKAGTDPDGSSFAEQYDFLAPAQQPDEIGRLGAYRILRVLGRGGMGIVFEAEETSLNRRVALKVMNPLLASRPEARQRFLREARATAALQHDHVVAIYRVDEENHVPFLTMPLLVGESLECRLQRDSKLPVGEMSRIGREIAEGLAAAHARGLMHRDIKPGNIWLEADPDARGSPTPAARVKLLDFGLSRAADDHAPLTEPGMILGTPAYMAPEQIDGQGDFTSDLFSLGCVLYRAATGVEPFQGESNWATLAAVRECKPLVGPRQRRADVPPELSDLIMRLLQKESGARPISARAVADSLAAMEAGSRVENAAGDVGKPRKKGQRRRRLLIALASGAAMVALVYFAPTIYRIATNQGELVVEINDPNVEISLRQNGVTIHDHTKHRSFVLTAGAGSVEFYDPTTGVRLETKEFKLERGGKAIVKVRQEPGGRQRQVALWALKCGGIIKVREAGKEADLRIDMLEQLPYGPFEIIDVSLNERKVTDDALERLRNFTSIRALGLNKTNVTDRGMSIVKTLTNLECLDLRETNVSDAGLAELGNLKRIWQFHVTGTVSNEGLASILRFDKLTELGLNHSRINNEGLALLAAHEKLEKLYLVHTDIDDAGLAHLANLKHLRVLHLTDTKVTFAGLQQFKEMKLRDLNVTNTQVTAEQADELRRMFGWIVTGPSQAD